MASQTRILKGSDITSVKKHLTLKAFWPLVAVAVPILLFLWYIGIFGGNIHAVVPGKVYRTAQLTGRNLDQVLVDDHIRTEINLRGGSLKNGYYRNEIEECQEHGVTHVDITLSARHLPPPIQLTKLLYVFDHDQYPIAYHCQAGADRTGLVTALYLNVYQHVPINEAETEGLTWHHGHFAWGATHAMNDFFTLYNKTNGGLDMRDWIQKTYPALYAKSNEK